MFPIPPTRFNHPVISPSQSQPAVKRSRAGDSEINNSSSQIKNRQFQLAELIRLNHGARAIAQDNSLFEIPISTVYGRLTLNVLFPSSLSSPPLVQVASLVDHPWVDDDMYFTNYAKLTSGWDNKTSNIGIIIQEIVQEWTKNPPMPQTANNNNHNNQNNNNNDNIIAMTDSPSGNNNNNINNDWVIIENSSQSVTEQKSPNTSQSQSSTTNSSLSSSSSASVLSSSSSSSSLLLPIPSSFLFIDRCSTPELERLAADSSHQLLTDELYSLDSVSHIEQVKSDIYKSLEESIAKNISQSENYEQIKIKLTKLRESFNKEQNLFNENQKKLTQLSARFSTSTLINILDEAIIDADKKSQELFENYLNGNYNSDNNNNNNINGDNSNISRRNIDQHSRFVEAYTKQRAIFHQRQAKRERISQINNHQNQNNNSYNINNQISFQGMK